MVGQVLRSPVKRALIIAIQYSGSDGPQPQHDLYPLAAPHQDAGDFRDLLISTSTHSRMTVVEDAHGET